MNTRYLEKCVNRITVTNMINADVEVVNKSPLKMIGKGRQGAVFQYSDDICVKVFGNVEDCEREYYALSLGQHTNLLPKVYAKGSLYIAMEIIKGVDIREYLQSQPLTKELSIKLIEMLITFKEIGYERIDHHKRQIYLQRDGTLKVIDVARTVWRDRVYPYPRKLLNSLGEEYKQLFLSHVQELAPELYSEWLHYIKMEDLSRQILQEHLTDSSGKDKKIKEQTKKLETTKDEKNYVVLLEGLVHKVFKEEWIKVMLAQGTDPDAVMERIDQHFGDFESDNNNESWENNYRGLLAEKKREREKKKNWGRPSSKEKQAKWDNKDKNIKKGERSEKSKKHK
ncbi:hypothetical protein [Bacillus sp. Marseille-P3661]|uniref:hypothetical protein n=1 Tax=Bacillus sp. Marseille-P3661 TaxID=1936234 RepID=UPI0021557B42|nr:hypothetical protein [Bacillus sp. Marseille-P3661]